jgi:hypothetical protein
MRRQWRAAAPVCRRRVTPSPTADSRRKGIGHGCGSSMLRLDDGRLARLNSLYVRAHTCHMQTRTCERRHLCMRCHAKSLAPLLAAGLFGPPRPRPRDHARPTEPHATHDHTHIHTCTTPASHARLPASHRRANERTNEKWSAQMRRSKHRKLVAAEPVGEHTGTTCRLWVTFSPSMIAAKCRSYLPYSLRFLSNRLTHITLEGLRSNPINFTQWSSNHVPSSIVARRRLR